MNARVKVLIIGAGGHGRGTLEILREVHREHGEFEVLGFLDDAPQKQACVVGGVPVLGGLDWIDANLREEHGYVIAIAETRVKQQIVQRLEARTLTFVSVIHPSVIIASGVRIAPGAIINAGVIVAYDTVIEEHTTVNLNATIGHDCTLGRFSTVAPGANIAGNVRVREGCDIGLNACVAAGLEIGAWSSVGPGAVILKDVPPGKLVFGNPARIVPLADQRHSDLARR